MITFLIIYFAVNLWVSGYVFCDEENIGASFICLFVGSFLPLLITLDWLWNSILMRYLFIDSLIILLCPNRYKRDESHLESFNKVIDKTMLDDDVNWLRKKNMNTARELVNKINNYIPSK